MSSRQRSTARKIEEKGRMPAEQRKKKLLVRDWLETGLFVMLYSPDQQRKKKRLTSVIFCGPSNQHTEWKVKPFSRWINLILEGCVCQPAKVVVRVNCKQLNRFCSTPTKTRGERNAETKTCLDTRSVIISTIFLPRYYANEDICIRLIYN